MYKNIFKPILDIVFSILLIIILFPLMIIISIILLFDIGCPIIFKQTRTGKNKKAFTMYKFRTMKDIDGDYYLKTTKFTRFLRNFGLDEIPQLFNILKQDMSFVGPRPFIVDEKLPTKPKKIIYSVLPGVTGLASAKGRRLITHQKRLEYDYKYIKNMNIFLDIKIIISTIFVLIKQNIVR